MAKMDLATLHMFSSLLSVIAQMSATIFVIFCVVNFFSIRPGSSLRIVLFSLGYFFVSMIVLFVGATLLMSVSPSHMLVGVSALIEASLINLCYGIIVSAIYLRSFVSER